MKNIVTVSILSLVTLGTSATTTVDQRILPERLKKPVKHISVHNNQLELPDILKPGKLPHKKHLHKPVFNRSGPTIQLAILLDTSGSMDGLIDQAKSQIWDIINATSKANKDQKDAVIEVALFEYGNDTISQNEGYIQMLSPLTSDLDAISQKLFQLRTNGGSEYAGKVILESVNRLAWSDNENDLKIIIIAGNESFEQGNVKYDYAINKAKRKDIIVNTVFCGDYRQGVNLKWREGSNLSGGAYLNINHNDKVRHIDTPFDEEINSLGYAMNSTYINYGAQGDKMKKRQSELDDMTMQESKAVLAKRNVAKASKSYNASSWDVISKFSSSKEEGIKAAQDSTDFKGLSVQEIEVKVAEISKKRTALKDKIHELTLKREKYIKLEREKSKDNNQDSFGAKLIVDIEKKAKEKGYRFK